MASRFDSAMIDIETGGLDPARSPVLAISGVKFNLRTREVCSEFFNISLLPTVHRNWDEGTREWWMKRKEVLQNLMMNAIDPRKGLIDLALWANGVKHMWAKPTHFDHSFLQCLYKDHGMQIPFHYREARDMASWLEGFFYPQEVPNLWELVEFQGEQHNSLDDTLHQLRQLFKALEVKEQWTTIPENLSVVDSEQSLPSS